MYSEHKTGREHRLRGFRRGSFTDRTPGGVVGTGTVLEDARPRVIDTGNPTTHHEVFLAGDGGTGRQRRGPLSIFSRKGRDVGDETGKDKRVTDGGGGIGRPPEVPGVGGEGDDEHRAERNLKRMDVLRDTLDAFNELVTPDPFQEIRPATSVISKDVKTAVDAIERMSHKEPTVRTEEDRQRVRELGPKMGEEACHMIHRVDELMKEGRKELVQAQTILARIDPTKHGKLTMGEFLDNAEVVSQKLRVASNRIPLAKTLGELDSVLDAEATAQEVDRSIAGLDRRPDLVREYLGLRESFNKREVDRETFIRRGTEIRIALGDAGKGDPEVKKAHRNEYAQLKDFGILEDAPAIALGLKKEGSAAHQKLREHLSHKAEAPAAELYGLIQELQQSIVALTPDRQDMSAEAKQNLSIAAQAERLLAERARDLRTHALQLNLLTPEERSVLTGLANAVKLQTRLKQIENGKATKPQEKITLTDDLKGDTRLTQAIVAAKFDRKRDGDAVRQKSEDLRQLELDGTLKPAERGLLAALAAGRLNLTTMAEIDKVRSVLERFAAKDPLATALRDAGMQQRVVDIEHFASEGTLTDTVREVREILSDARKSRAVVSQLVGTGVPQETRDAMKDKLSAGIDAISHYLETGEKGSKSKDEAAAEPVTSEQPQRARSWQESFLDKMDAALTPGSKTGGEQPEVQEAQKDAPAPGEKTVVSDDDMDIIAQAMRLSEGVSFDPLHPAEEGDIRELPLDLVQVTGKVIKNLTEREKRIYVDHPEELIIDRIRNIIGIVEENGGRLFQSMTKPVLNGSYLIGIFPYVYEADDGKQPEVYRVGILENPMKDNATYGIIEQKVNASTLWVAEKFGKEAVRKVGAAFRVFHSKEEPVYHRGRVFKRLRRELADLRENEN